MNAETEHAQPAPPAAQSESLFVETLSRLTEVVRLVIGAQEEQTRVHERMRRRDLLWRNVRTVLLVASVLGAALLYSVGLRTLLTPPITRGPYAAVVRIDGLIESDQRANASKVNASLRAAFEDPKARGVIVLINSPGGSPVQSALIHDRLASLQARFPEKDVWAVGEDMLTSGAYYIAVAAHHVCVQRGTMTGSIGVVSTGWGLSRAIARLGIERRVFVAGENKARLDPFQPLAPADQRKAQSLLQAIHEQFITAVKEGRGPRLKGAPEVLYNGDYWTGEEAVDLGLADGLCDLSSVVEERLGATEIRDYTAIPSVWTALGNSLGVVAEQWVGAQLVAAQPQLLP